MKNFETKSYCYLAYNFRAKSKNHESDNEQGENSRKDTA